MEQIFLTAAVLLLPMLCTTAGAAGVFLLRKTGEPATRRMLCGMAAGIMLAASVWSLLLPAIERAEQGPLPAWVPPAVGLLLGAVGLLRLETLAGRLLNAGPGRSGRMVLAVTLHNLPEGWWALPPRWRCGVNRMPSAGRWPLRWASGCRTFPRELRSACHWRRRAGLSAVLLRRGLPPGLWSRWGACWPLHWPGGSVRPCPG